MKKLAFLLISTALCTSALASPAPSIPKLFFEHGALFDRGLCSKMTDKPVTAVMVNELESFLPEINNEWNKNGQILLETTTRLFNIPFTRKELSVNFIACNTPFTGMSYPLTISLHKFLKSTAEKPLSLAYLNLIIYHELLHRYIYADLPSPDYTPPLLKKYKSENSVVLAHLHLLAIQKYVYHALDRDAEFEEELAYLSGDYQRAWEIVTIEGYMAFVNEIRDFLNRGA